MAAFILRAVHLGGAFTHSSGLTDLTVANVQGQLRLYTASGADGGLSVFDLRPGRAAMIMSEVGGSSATGTLGVADVEIATIGGQAVLAAAGRYDDEFAYRRLDTTGDFLGVAAIPSIPISTAALTELEIVTVGTRNYLIAGRDNGGGLNVFDMTADLGLTHLATLADSVSTTLANVSDLVAFDTGQTRLVFAASGIEHGVTSAAIDSSGNLGVIDTVRGMKGLGIYQPTQLAVAEVGGSDFLLVGAAGSNNLSVFEISPDGHLSLRDMVWDSLDTRFRNVTALDVFELNDRSFVLAGGNDGGMSLFELGPNGKLYILTSVTDTVATTLASVSAIEAVNVGGEIQVFVASGNEVGMTQFSLDLGAIGNLVTPSGPVGDAVGGPGDDFLVGTDARNSLFGFAGNDRLVDGGDVDMLYGGAGADTFVFMQDGMYDRVMDYQPGIDTIDLSDFDMVYSIADLGIHSADYGAKIMVAGEAILLVTQNGQPLSAADFSTDGFIF
ncbi:M10 family metallopeptidase C-terminal domain-containing protein [Defluviimonas sp. SAOS-178_SWC]|uniref:M10 family metallopeptidase C-terminal domain-containing protein n=1 Tax=Defluviimonas sp. SAOS-178_SWC TaxID=3121287 RepID=UPI0032216D62